MHKILFICHGNICRSPMAEYIMKQLAEEAGAEDEFEISSAATSAEEIGNPVYPPVRKLLSQRGIDCGGKRARRLTRGDAEQYDLLIGMDRENLEGMKRICGREAEGKFRLLLDYTEQPGDVDDPWYTRDFERTMQEIGQGCRGLLEQLCGTASRCGEEWA